MPSFKVRGYHNQRPAIMIAVIERGKIRVIPPRADGKVYARFLTESPQGPVWTARINDGKCTWYGYGLTIDEALSALQCSLSYTQPVQPDDLALLVPEKRGLLSSLWSYLRNLF